MNRRVIWMAAAVLGLGACTPGVGEAPGGTAPSTNATPSASASTFDGDLGDILYWRMPEGSGEGALFTSDADGSHEQLVHASWDGIGASPDGTAFMSPTLAPDGRILPLIVRTDGSDEHLLAISDPNLQLGVGDWSPDGTHLVLDGWDKSDGSREGLYTVSVDGSNLRQLTHAGSRHDFPAYAGAYSPNGKRVLFFRPADRVDGDGEPMNLFVVSADGTGITKLNPSGVESILLGPSGASDWSPDGEHVAFVGSDGDFWATQRRAVFVVDADGSHPRRMTPWGDVLSVQWSPDGRLLAFTMGSDIYTIHPDGTRLARLTSEKDGDFSSSPMWSPDGSQILFVRGSGELLDRGPVELWTMNADGTDPVQVFGSAAIAGFDWAP
jgi:Tol biopolymer transport system component